jgi:hypothetical protein
MEYQSSPESKWISTLLSTKTNISMIANFISKNLPEEDSFMNSNTPVMNLQFTCGIF